MIFRKSFASAIVALFVAMVWLPLAENPAKQLPECCRRGGKHHCSMPDSSGTRQFSEVCPHRKAPASTAARVSMVLPGLALPVFTASKCMGAAERLSVEVAAFRNPDRGPPVSHTA